MLYSVKQNKKGLRRLLLLLYQVQCILQQYILYTSILYTLPVILLLLAAMLLETHTKSHIFRPRRTPRPLSPCFLRVCACAHDNLAFFCVVFGEMTDRRRSAVSWRVLVHPAANPSTLFAVGDLAPYLYVASFFVDRFVERIQELPDR